MNVVPFRGWRGWNLREIREQSPATIHDMYILAFPRKIVAKREIRINCPLWVFERRSLILRYRMRWLRCTTRKLCKEWRNNGGQEDYKWLFCASFFASVYSSLMIIVSIFIAFFEKRFFIELFTRLLIIIVSILLLSLRKDFLSSPLHDCITTIS